MITANRALVFLLAWGVCSLVCVAQEKTPDEPTETPPATERLTAPKAVNVTPEVADSEISTRLTRILKATEWFEEPRVEVQEGVAFLSGSTDDEKYRQWAGELSRNTQDVVAVVNRIELTQPDLFDLSASYGTVKSIIRKSVQSIPIMLAALLVLLFTFFAMFVSGHIADHTLLRRFQNKLLRGVVRKGLLLLVFLLGIYLVLQIAGLTRLAATVLGGTGLFGLIVGIAFRDIAENFLASILISMQNPFRYGDLIEVEGIQGFVQRVNTRGTLLMSLDGNHIQIPNAIIYKSKILNFTSNPKVRLDFLVGVGYDVPLNDAQSIAKGILESHPAVLDDPEPIVLVESLGSSTVNLRLYYWINGHQFSVLKVNSSMMRLVKTTFEERGFSMPDDAREVIFPQGVPVTMVSAEEAEAKKTAPAKQPPLTPPRSPVAIPEEETVTEAEGSLASEYNELERQSQQARDPEEDSTDLLSS
ncbi:mechanosensitive ion channel family protein [Gimesia sp.]|uniref:mechanosensitive ion channel family protein n=1 Tax=Gimesia sp. TaxID=2024833 RepID=UPI000C4B0C77|nr:mechanosensitive ion channel family protein [Gimesia sp.]MAX40626.1 mechanosensitive ion channel protein MscS [Gimesia sp.]HBL41888.1 mechanosensitive ion channel protein MscS [Planctomycetaceae bacterium]|tara:strand:- start:588 stop:2009 length:1422 start_codon:yes stop_codon:yes gene_type:complete